MPLGRELSPVSRGIKLFKDEEKISFSEGCVTGVLT
jgi:hypothetical protein